MPVLEKPPAPSKAEPEERGQINPSDAIMPVVRISAISQPKKDQPMLYRLLRKQPSQIPALSASYFAPWLVLAAIVTLGAKADDPSDDRSQEKQIIGATADLTEATTGFALPARVDTGAKTCSLHVEKWEIEDEEEKMRANIGKQIRFLVKDPQSDKTEWIEAKVVGYAIYKTSEKQERRYKVRLNLKWNDLEKEVLVNLNDRSHLEFPLLLGRNYLRGDLLVDVDVDNDD